MGDVVGGRFEIETEAGAGAMARVYRARDTTTGELVAVKVLNGLSEHTMRRFAREVSAMSELSHPGIVRYISHGRTSAGHAYLAMEWLAGESLDARLERGPLGCADALALVRAVAAALGAAHARGIVHRDVKPANIFLVGGEVTQPRLVDFGLARDLDATFALTNTGDLLGTPLYMAPEQASCELNLDSRVDVYALGAVLYACVTGRPPIVATTLVALLAKIVLDEPPLASTIQRDVPVVVDDLLMRLLAKQRDARPADGQAAEAAVASAIAGLASSRPRSASVLPAREQRVVSILLATDSRTTEESLDATLGSYGGALALADGSTMVVFDGPETPADLASRAARHALRLRRPDVCASLATGRAVLSGPTPMGEVIDRAAGDLAGASGQIRIDRETAGLIEGRFELASDERGTILVGLRAGELDAMRTLLGKPTRCIGRDRELAAIEGYFAEVISDSTARVVLVVADAGVGKSRLAHELGRRLATRDDAPEVIVARCESITARSPFACAAAAVRRAAGIEPTDRPELHASRLATLLARDGAGEVVEFLGEMLGIHVAEPSERLQAARENPALMLENIRAAWITWFERASARRPVLLVIEDLHWADEPSVLLVDAVLGSLAEARFMVLALARPEIRVRKPWAAHQPHELRLDALSRRASERLVRETLGAAATDAVVADIITRAEGNALFLEELIRASTHPDGGALPIGVIGTLQRRFDILRPEARTALRAASVFGEHFTAPGIAALVPSDLSVPAALEQLEVAELVARHADGFAFRHALVREAAYGLIPDEDRAIGHALAARLLERTGTPDPSVIARHFELGQQRPDAARWYARAAERALGANDLEGALAHAERARPWTDDDTALGALDLIVAEAELWRGRLQVACTTAERAATHLPPATAAWFDAVGLIITTSGQLGDNELVASWLARAMELEPAPDARSAFVLCVSRGSSQLAWADRNGDVARRALTRADAFAYDSIGPSAAARLEFARAYNFILDGRVDACAETLHRVSTMYARIGSARDALQMKMIAYMLSMQGGYIDEAHPLLVECVAEAERLEARYLADWARWEVVIALLYKGERARAEAELAAIPTSLVDQPLFRDVMNQDRAWAAYAAGDIDDVERIVTTAAVPTYRRFGAALSAYRAYVHLHRRHDVTGACEQARAAIAALVAAPALLADGCMAAFAPALETLVHGGAPDAARSLDEHIARIDAVAARLASSEARDAFRSRVPWNRRVLALRAP